MQTLLNEFSGALTRIEVDPKPAIAAQAEVRGVLEMSERLRQWGVDTILIGSYSRNTGIHPAKDVDIFAKLTKLDATSTSPMEVFELVRDVLVAKYGNRATPQPRSVKVSFPDHFCADVVPAVRFGTHWAIPNRDTRFWVDPKQRWRETDPEKLGQLVSQRNAYPTVNGQGALVPTVKLMRQTREHHLGDRRPGGLYMEMATYWAFQRSAAFGASFAEIAAAILRLIGDQLSSGTVLNDPALGTTYTPAPSPDELSAAGRKFRELAEKAKAALDMDPCQAAAVWRQILGKNPDGPCFPLPDGCDEYGKKVGSIAAVAATGPNEARPFA
jgi:Second Messenger Oligonucleotide or Dinucleotide Synthetase domain